MTRFRAFLVWLLLFAIAFANGAFREGVIRRFLGELPAHQLSCALGTSLILLAVVVVGRKWPFTSDAQAWKIGIAWLAMTVAWEFLFFHFVIGYPWPRLLQDYAIWDGRLWIAVLAAILCAPAVSRALSRRRP